MQFRSISRELLAASMILTMACTAALPSAACTSMVFKAQDGTAIYARTMEWGASDLHSQMVLVPRETKFSSQLAIDKTGKVVYTGLGGKQDLDAAIRKAF